MLRSTIVQPEPPGCACLAALLPIDYTPPVLEVAQREVVMEIVLEEVKTRKDLKRFIFLPAKIHKGRKNWVPPIWIDEWSVFDPEKNNSFAHCDTIRLLAWRGEELVGRIMGIINRRYNEHREEKIARWAWLEAWEDREVIHALLARVEEWARQSGMERIIGPYGFSDQDPEGYLIEGFEHRATIATYYNFEWLPGIIEDEGYVKDMDYFVYTYPIPDPVPEHYAKICERVKKRGFEVTEFTKRKELKPWVKPILGLMNETYTETNIYGYTPLTEKEMEALARRYLPMLDPRLVKAVFVDGEPVAFVISMPDLTLGIQQAKGRLFPFGLLKIVRAAKRTEQLDLLLGAVKKEYRGKGLDILMGTAIFRSGIEAGLNVIDTHHEMETNEAVRSGMERMGGVIYKIFRVWQKQL
ncbi:GNAT family N-acetyltransferase [Gemmatimonadota bacterium]